MTAAQYAYSLTGSNQRLQFAVDTNGAFISDIRSDGGTIIAFLQKLLKHISVNSTLGKI